MEAICRDVVSQVQRERVAVSDMGELLVEWAKIEERILRRARQLTERNISAREAIHALVSQKSWSRNG